MRLWRRADMAQVTSSFSNRTQASARMAIACLLIVTLSMSLEIPNAALSAYLVFFVSREDMVTTALTGFALIGAVTVAIAATLLCDLITFDQPALRVMLMAVLFFVGMFLSRVLTAGPVGFGLGFVLLLTQSTVDLYQTPEALVRDTLWTWTAFSFAAALVVMVNLVLFPARPLALLRDEARRCLNFASTSLTARQVGQGAPSMLVGTNRLTGLVHLARISNPRLRAGVPRFDDAARALTFLTEACAMLNTLPAVLIESNSVRLTMLLATCRQFIRALDAGEPLMASAMLTELPESGTKDAVLLNEIGFHLRTFGAAWDPNAIAIQHLGPARRTFVVDAGTNPAHLQFALKSTFAAMLCYILYTALDWPGIHTCVITCAVIALTSEGATLHKASLRFAGALVGGAFALIATVFIVPHLDSIGGLLLTIAPVAALSAWISAGSERTAYFGWQIAFAFFLCILHGFGPSIDVTLVRDRLVGVLLGILVMAWVFRYVWPERADTKLRALLARALQAVAAMATAPIPSIDEFAEQRSRILSLVTEAERSAALAIFERVSVEDSTRLLTAARNVIIEGLHAAQPATHTN